MKAAIMALLMAAVGAVPFPNHCWEFQQQSEQVFDSCGGVYTLTRASKQ